MISLTKGAEQLSRAVLESGPQYSSLVFIYRCSSRIFFSDPEVVHHHHDLSAQLLSRIERLSWLVGFINDNAVLLKVCFLRPYSIVYRLTRSIDATG